jgi:hypothetical protein
MQHLHHTAIPFVEFVGELVIITTCFVKCSCRASEALAYFVQLEPGVVTRLGFASPKWKTSKIASFTFSRSAQSIVLPGFAAV